MVLAKFDDLCEMPAEQFGAELKQICGCFDVEPTNSLDQIAGHISSRSKAGLDFAFVGQNANTVHRRGRNIRQDPGNHFFLVVQDRGVSRMSQADTIVDMEPGDMFLVDSTQASSFHCDNGPSMQVSLHLPRDEMLHRFGKRIKGGISIGRKDPLGQAMRSVLMELLDGKQQRQGHVAEALYGILGAFLLNRSLGEAGQPDPNRQMVNRALHFMSLYYADPNFSPAQIADLTGVSLRQLQRAFSAVNDTPHRRLQQMRLEAADQMLDRLQIGETRSVAATAFECGFRDLSTFYRQFKERYGCAPGEKLKLSHAMQ